jgi:hypothetical protein
LIGLDSLKRIAIESENERSREESMDLLVDLLLKFNSEAEVSKDDQHAIWASFIESSMQ